MAILTRSLPLLLVLIFAVLLSTACPSEKKPPDDTDNPAGDTGGLGRYAFSEPVAIGEPGIIDAPNLLSADGITKVHCTYLLNDGGSQRIQYVVFENSIPGNPSLLSEQEGRKIGGGNLAMVSGDLIAYWINVKATGGQLRYRVLARGERNFTRPSRWNHRNEARWPVVVEAGGATTAYFFLHALNDWELVSNRAFSDESELTIDIPDGPPLNLQAVSDGRDLVWLAYYQRRENSDEGRIAFLKSVDGGRSFVKSYMFNDQIIRNLSGYFSMTRETIGRMNVMHVVYTEETPDMTTVYYARSEDDGEHFSTPVAVITSEIPLSRTPLTVSNGHYVFIAMADATDEGPGLRYILSEDGGNSFNQPVTGFSAVSSPGTMVGVIDDNGSLMLVWDDISAGSVDGEQLYVVTAQLRGQ